MALAPTTTGLLHVQQGKPPRHNISTKVKWQGHQTQHTKLRLMRMLLGQELPLHQPRGMATKCTALATAAWHLEEALQLLALAPQQHGSRPGLHLAFDRVRVDCGHRSSSSSSSTARSLRWGLAVVETSTAAPEPTALMAAAAAAVLVVVAPSTTHRVLTVLCKKKTCRRGILTPVRLYPCDSYDSYVCRLARASLPHGTPLLLWSLASPGCTFELRKLL